MHSCHYLINAALALPLLLATIHASPTPRHHRASRRDLSTNVLQLKQTGGSPASSRLLFEQHDHDQTSYAPLAVMESGAGYAVDLTFGGEQFTATLDTGSSDLWLPSPNFTCLDAQRKVVPFKDCGLDKKVTRGFTGGVVPDQNFNITYGDGSYLTGELGYEDVTLAGITVKNQEVALVDRGYWMGDGRTDGLFGFAYPAITSAFTGEDGSKDDPAVNAAPYSPFFFNAISQGQVDPIFSMIIERGANGGGQLALGGLPSVAYNRSFISTPLKIVQLSSYPSEAKSFSFYSIIPDGVVITKAPSPSSLPSAVFSNGSATANNRSHAQPLDRPTPLTKTDQPMIVDSGTTLMYLPQAIVYDIAAAFDPPAEFAASSQLLETSCTAIPPTVSIRIGGMDFPIDGRDLIVKDEANGAPSDLQTNACVLGVQVSTGLNVLGDTFMKNVISVFDIGKSEMRFAPYVY